MFAGQPDLTYDEYLTYEQASPTKYEFVSGQAFAMAGASEDHNVISSSLIACIRPHAG